MKKIVILIAMMVIIAGCKDKKIDSSSNENLKKSIETVKKPLSSEKRQEFEEAMEAIAMSEIGNIFKDAAYPEGMMRRFKDKLNGKTANEIIAEGNRIIAEREEEKRKMAIERQEHIINEIAATKERIAELEKKRAKAEQDKESRRQFAIILSQFSARESSYQENVYQIELTVKNGTKHTISKVIFQCVFASPGRSVPWVRAHLPHDIPGGLEPGEQATWVIGAYKFEDIPKGRDDIVLTVTPIDFYGEDEKAIFETTFSKWEEMRLEELSQRLEKLKKEKLKVSACTLRRYFFGLFAKKDRIIMLFIYFNPLAPLEAHFPHF